MKKTTLLLLALAFAFAGNAQNIIHYWSFNSGSSSAADSAWFTPPSADTTLSSPDTGYITHNIAHTEDFSGTNLNAPSGVSSGNAFVARNNLNNGSAITFHLPTTNKVVDKLTMDSRRTSTGFDTITVEYTTNGTTWMTHPASPLLPTSSWVTYTFDLDTITGADSNSSFKIRFTIDGASSSSGNARFDNVKLEEKSSTPPPPPAVAPTYLITQIRGKDANGVVDSNGVKCYLNGIVVSPNFRSSGVEFFLNDNSMPFGGIQVRNTGFSGYNVRVGDSLRVHGTVGGFRGLAQFNVDSIWVMDSMKTVKAPRLVTALNDTTESDVIKLDSVWLVDTTGWPTANFGNFDVTNGTDTFLMRMDSDLGWTTNMPNPPLWKFEVAGVGSRFANSSTPHVGGYQILPRDTNDFNLYRAPCAAPSGMTATQISPTSVRLSWTSLSGMSDIEYDTAGFTLGNGMMVMGVSSTYDVTGLTTGSSYEFYYRDTCAGNGTSGWVGPVSITLSSAPQISMIWRTTSTNVMVAYTDSMDNASATATARYKGIAGLTGVTLNASNDTATLTYGTPFANGVGNMLTIDSVLNAGQIMLDTVYTYNFTYNNTKPQLVISEIMYNDLSGPDTLEYLEVMNNGSTTAILGGLRFVEGIGHDFAPGLTLAAGAYIVVAKDSANVRNVFNIASEQWRAGGLSNSGEDLLLVNSDLDTIDFVDYDDGNGWPTDPDGNGYSLVLCDPNSDNNVGANWGVEPALWPNTNFYASPTQMNTCRGPIVYPTYPISLVRTVDSDGIPDSNGVKCYVEGTVITPSYRRVGGGYEFHINDASSPLNGINVIRFSGSAYVPRVGDSVRVLGEVDHYNGHIQLQVIDDSLWVLDSNRMVPQPMLTTVLDESTESKLLQMNEWELVDTSGWPTANFGNFDITNGTDTVLMRMDGDRGWAAKMPNPPLGKFCFIGVGGQFDPSRPHFSGYQILPRDTDDFIMCPPPAGPCGIPTNVAVSNIAQTTADVNWNTDGNGTSWTVAWSETTTPSDSITGLTDSTYSITGLTANTSYNVWVKQICTGGESAYSAAQAFTTLDEDTTSVRELAGRVKFSAYPNPNGTEVVHFNRVSDVTFRNMLGQIVKVAREVESVNIADLIDGMYLIENEEGEVIRLIVR